MRWHILLFTLYDIRKKTALLFKPEDFHVDCDPLSLLQLQKYSFSNNSYTLRSSLYRINIKRADKKKSFVKKRSIEENSTVRLLLKLLSGLIEYLC